MNMKKYISFLLTFIIVISLTGCAQKTESEDVPPEEATVHYLEVGETAKTDTVQFTMDKIQFTDKVGLDSDCWLKPTNKLGGIISAGDGKVYVWFSFTAKNLSKEEISGYDVCNIVVDYNDGYIYDGGVFSSGYNSSTSSYISKNVGLYTLDPLEEDEYYGYILCIDEVRSNREAPLLLTVTLPSSNGDVKFSYNYTASAAADTSEDAKACSDAFHVALDQLSFISQYAGNVNNDGSRKFADSFIESTQNSLSGLKTEYIESNCPETAEALPTIRENIDSICDMLIEMGNTNSTENIETIKSMAKDTMDDINTLLSIEFSAFN